MKRALVALLCVLTCVGVSQGADIIWVSFHSADDAPDADAVGVGFTLAPDVGYTQLLADNGHNVTRYVSTGTPDTGLLDAADLVIISRSVGSGEYQDDPETAAWNGITAPTMVLSGYLLRNSRLGYTTGATIPDTAGTIGLAVNDPTHPIFSGIALNPDNTMVNAYADIVTFNTTVMRGISVNTDAVAGGGQILATVATAGDPAVGGMIIGEWQAGAVMSTSPADTLGGHRLAFLTGSREGLNFNSHGAGIYDLTPDGAQLFLNAVNYMAIPEPSTLILLAVGGVAVVLRRRRRV